MSMDWQDNPANGDYPQCLVNGLQLTDIDSGPSRSVIAPWIHSLYRTTYKNQPSGVTEIKLEEAQFAESFTAWQHKAVLGVLCFQSFLGVLFLARHQRREGTLILPSILLQMVEGYYAWKYPIHRPPRAVARARYYVLHKGLTSTHFFLISHRPQHIPPNAEKPHVNLEDIAAPPSRKGYRRIQEAVLIKVLQLANISLKVGAVISPTDSLIVAFTLKSELLCWKPLYPSRRLFRDTLEWSRWRPPILSTQVYSSVLDMLAAISQKTGCISVRFMESILPDPAGIHVDYEWIAKVLRSKGALLSGIHPTHQTATTLSIRDSIAEDDQFEGLNNAQCRIM